MHNNDSRLDAYIRVVQCLQDGDYCHDFPNGPPDQIGELGRELAELARVLRQLDRISQLIGQGVLLDDILETIYQNLKTIIPYNRIGLAFIEDGGQTVRAYWAATDQPVVRIKEGYSAALNGSSLATIMQTGEPRIINNLDDYLEAKPSSLSTRLMLEEGMRSSLTCPLKIEGEPVGFLFFSSVDSDTYVNVHVDVFKRIAAQVALAVERGRLVSELAAQKADIEAKNRELMRLNEVRNSFIGVAAHDLRNPITGIQLALDLLLNYGDRLSPEEIEAILKDSRQQTAHMLVLLNDMLNITQIESGRLELALEAIDMQDFLNVTIRRHNQLAAPKGTHVSLELLEDQKIVADPQRLRQVMDNLISNAVKFSPPNSEIQVSAEKVANGIRVAVTDQGPGVTEADRQHLFEDFVRLSARPTGGESSTGLGLAISKRIVSAHGGTIGVESKVGDGATFWFILPN